MLTLTRKKELYNSIMSEVAKVVKNILYEDKKKYDGLTRRQRSAQKRGEIGNLKYSTEADIKRLIHQKGNENKQLVVAFDDLTFDGKDSYNGKYVKSSVEMLTIENNKVYVVLSDEHQKLFVNLKSNDKTKLLKRLSKEF